MKSKRYIYNSISIALAVILLFATCKKDYDDPTGNNKVILSNVSVEEVSDSYAHLSAQLLNTGGSTLTAHGFCWSTDPLPDISDDHIDLGILSSAVIFSSVASDLLFNHQYFIRAFATIPTGTIYSDEISFNTQPEILPVKDIDGNVYKTVKIGTQVWMAENLKTTKLNDGTPIPFISDSVAWINMATKGYCWLNNESGNFDTYGALYNWYAVNSGKLAPPGWHIPSDDEWSVLINFIGGDTIAGGKLKEVGTSHWHSTNFGATDEYGFKALPGGLRYQRGDYYPDLGNIGIWWSSTEYDDNNSWLRSIYYFYAHVIRNAADKGYGLSVRCIKD